jgi:hypothetical protein
MQRVFDRVWNLEKQANAADVLFDLDWRSQRRKAHVA